MWMAPGRLSSHLVGSSYSMHDACSAYLLAGSHRLGEMPTPNEMAELSLPIAGSQQGGGGSSANSASHSASGDTSTTDSISLGSRDETTGTTLPPATQEDVHQPFILSEGLAPVPVKLVAKILRGEFVDMAELLRDNLEALRRGTLQDPMVGDAPSAKRLRREIPDILSWMQCFGTFIAVIASKCPDSCINYSLIRPSLSGRRADVAVQDGSPTIRCSVAGDQGQ